MKEASTKTIDFRASSLLRIAFFQVKRLLQRDRCDQRGEEGNGKQGIRGAYISVDEDVIEWSASKMIIITNAL